MTATSSASDPNAGGIRSVVARHPVVAMLIAMFTISYALLIPPALAGLPLEPFLLGVIFLGQLLPAVLVTAAIGGRPAVRELFRRVFRWRVHPMWYLVALLAIPVVALLASAVVFGPGALRALVTDPAVILAYLNQLTILPLVNLWEETAWMGVIQARLADNRGPVLAAVITGPLFGLVHLPLQLGEPLGELGATDGRAAPQVQLEAVARGERDRAGSREFGQEPVQGRRQGRPPRHPLEHGERCPPVGDEGGGQLPGAAGLGNHPDLLRVVPVLPLRGRTGTGCHRDFRYSTRSRFCCAVSRRCLNAS